MRIQRELTAIEILKRSHLNFKLIPISIRELFFISELPSDIYTIEDGLFKLVLKKKSFINKAVIKDLVSQGALELFAHRKDRENIIKSHQDNLRNITRSLSIGNPLEKAKLLFNLLTINMEYLYMNPTDDDILNLQYQSVKNLASFLQNNMSIHKELYESYIEQKHHFIFAQPLISSLFLIGVLKMSHLYGQKDIENLFIASYFKDIGMSAIPTKKYDQKELNDEEKILLSKHSKHSVEILNGRVPISSPYLKIIENHHSFSLLQQELDNSTFRLSNESSLLAEHDDDFITGFETMAVCVMDIIAAMTQERPFRKKTNLFEALELAKILMAEQYPHEFRIIVNYFKSFFFQK